jgi:hypothetical protein
MLLLFVVDVVVILGGIPSVTCRIIACGAGGAGGNCALTLSVAVLLVVESSALVKSITTVVWF